MVENTTINQCAIDSVVTGQSVGHIQVAAKLPPGTRHGEVTGNVDERSYIVSDSPTAIGECETTRTHEQLLGNSIDRE